MSTQNQHGKMNLPPCGHCAARVFIIGQFEKWDSPNMHGHRGWDRTRAFQVSNGTGQENFRVVEASSSEVSEVNGDAITVRGPAASPALCAAHSQWACNLTGAKLGKPGKLLGPIDERDDACDER
jgi:hypothetical protein